MPVFGFVCGFCVGPSVCSVERFGERAVIGLIVTWVGSTMADIGGFVMGWAASLLSDGPSFSSPSMLLKSLNGIFPGCRKL